MEFLIPKAMTPFFKNNKVFINQILLILNVYNYLMVLKAREKKIIINIDNLMAQIQKVKDRKRNYLTNTKTTVAFTKKWHIINNIIP